MPAVVTTLNLSRPGFPLAVGDWYRETTTVNGVVTSTVEHEYHGP
jgi:hypothetical protein